MALRLGGGVSVLIREAGSIRIGLSSGVIPSGWGHLLATHCGLAFMMGGTQPLMIGRFPE